MLKGLARAAVVMAASIGLAASSLAQGAYPSKQITLVVPYAAGGPSDSIARLTKVDPARN